jgi:hypothetical protein
MAYASQREDAVGRSWRRTQKVERALGIDGSPGRQMHKKTRERLYDALEREECLRDGMLADGLARLFANAGSRAFHFPLGCFCDDPWKTNPKLRNDAAGCVGWCV